MLINFFFTLKHSGVPVTIRELLDLIRALQARLAFASMDQFYMLSRAVMVKDEKYFDKFDRAFGIYFEGLEDFDNLLEALIPEDWLRKEFEKALSDEDKAKLESLGSLEKLIEEFKKRLEEQKEKHAGGNKWIGTGGTSPFGQEGYHPEGIRVGPNGKNKRAVKVWDKREFKDLDDSNEITSRTMSVALRRLRKFARTGSQDELDLDNTISATARNAGLLDIKMRAERHNAVKVLLFFDVGGSMDPFIRVCEQLFSAARSEFKHLEYFYFHNFLYDGVWQNNQRRNSEMIEVNDILHKYARDYKIIFVGDASMSPYEILQAGGSVEFWNEQPGRYWFEKLKANFDKLVWLNPVPEEQWHWTQSIEICQQLSDDKMYPMTIEGLESAMAYLSK
ncbi:MAG: VWA domain-containing protein [Pseudomonadales bacterium]|nr:VWA domain-containing protein [Pseudomonadales bacterium]